MSETEFTAEELATLRRFEQAPFAPECRYRDMNPLVPTGEIRPAHEVAPPPGPDSTAAEWSAYYLAQSYAAHGLGLHLMRLLDDFRDAPVADVQEMSNAYAEHAHLFALGFLLRHVSDDVARTLAELLEMGETDELTFEWLRNAGVNPQHIRSDLTRAEAIAAGEARRAERAGAVS